MTNEELVELIQVGERELLPELWAQVEQFVAQQARRRLVLSGGLGGWSLGTCTMQGISPCSQQWTALTSTPGGPSSAGWLSS